MSKGDCYMPTLQLSELPEDVRIGAAASFAYLNRSYGLLAAHAGGDLIDARRVLEALGESVSVTTVSLAAHQELAIQQFIQRGEEGASRTGVPFCKVFWQIGCSTRITQ
jgi:hypothetical protein